MKPVTRALREEVTRLRQGVTPALREGVTGDSRRCDGPRGASLFLVTPFRVRTRTVRTGSPISRRVSSVRTKSGDDPGRDIAQFTAADLSFLQPFIASPASASGVMNRTSHPSGSSRNNTAVPTLAALLPQKHLGTVLRPRLCADRWLPAGGARPVWLAIRATHLLQISKVGIRRGVQSDPVATCPDPRRARRP
jgi:hypothetical protein